ncbi:MAG: glutaredoxin [Labilithrix sp.]
MNIEQLKPVRVYQRRLCIWCWKAKRLLGRHRIPFETVDASSDATRAWLRERTGRRTVPQVFFGDDHIGGFDDLAALEASGSLMTRLSA